MVEGDGLREKAGGQFSELTCHSSPGVCSENVSVYYALRVKTGPFDDRSSLLRPK